MSRKRKHKRQLNQKALEKCIHCVERNATTRDHVVGRGFFARQPQVHLTAPACAGCNNSLSVDEEYVRNLLCLSAGTFYGHPIAAELAKGKVARSLTGSSKLNFVYQRSATVTNVKTAGGIVLPNQVVIDGDMSRINRVMEKITRGLLYCYAKTLLPKDYHVVVDFDLAVPEFYEWMAVISQASPFGKQAFPDEVFGFTGAWNRENPAESVWLMSFYKRFTALTTTAQPGAKMMAFADKATGKLIAGIEIAA